jgi:hypothetical protein
MIIQYHSLRFGLLLFGMYMAPFSLSLWYWNIRWDMLICDCEAVYNVLLEEYEI